MRILVGTHNKFRPLLEYSQQEGDNHAFRFCNIPHNCLYNCSFLKISFFIHVRCKNQD